MRILILNWRDPNHPHAGGAEKSVLEHAKYWHKKGADVTWYSSGFKNSKREEGRNGIKIIRVGNHYTTHILFIIDYLLFGKLKGFDIVIDCFHFLPYFTPLFMRQEKKIAEEQLYRIKARSVLKNVTISSSTAKFLAAVIFWCEGSKNERGSVRLINSDPNVISSFLYLAKRGFGVPRNRWKARVHLHEYHSDRKQKQFWANRTGIPI